MDARIPDGRPPEAARRLGVELRRLRRERGLAQRDLRRSLNLGSHTAIVAFESGRRIPSEDIMAAYERHFGLARGRLRQLRLDALAERADAEARRQLAIEATARSDRDLPLVPRLLPKPPTHFTGRGAELALLDRYLRNESGTPVVLSAIAGMGGVGKTALAVQWGHLARGRFPDGDLYLDLRGYHPSKQPMTPTEALGLLLSAVGLPPGRVPFSAEERGAMFRTLTAGSALLLVLDNASSEDQVRPLMPGSPSCTVLITSRNRLGGLVARDGFHRIDLDVLTPAEAVRLLRRIVGAERADAEPGAMAALAELCGNHPLALRIAAERLGATSSGTVAEAVDRLTDRQARLDALAVGGDEASAVRAVFMWSYDALDADHKHLFRVLGLHEGPDIAVSAAAALAGCTTERCGQLLAGLRGAHLIEETASGRFRLHDLLHLLARDRAESEDTSADRLAATARAGSWYLHSACAARAALNPHLPPMEPPAPVTSVLPVTFASRVTALSWYQTEQANLVAASAVAAETSDLLVAWQLPTAMYAYFELSKGYDDWIRTHRAAISAACLLGDEAAQGRVLCNLGNAYRPLGQFDEAATCYREALSLFISVGYRQGEAKVLGNLASVYSESGRLELSVSTGEAAISLFRELGDQHGEALGLANLGQAYSRIGRYDDATTCQRRAIELFAELGDRHGQARATGNLGVVECALSRFGQAASLLTSALADFIELGDRYEEATILVHLADVHAARGEAADERNCLKRARDIFCDIGNTLQQREIELRLAGER